MLPGAPTFAATFLGEAREILDNLDCEALENAVDLLCRTRAAGGRLFILGVGGSAGNASHAVNDFRKLANIESYSPSDNTSELTARINDEGWASCYSDWLAVSRLSARDLILVFSVGGGNLQSNVSPNLVKALELAKHVGANIIGVVGKDGGFTKTVATTCILIPTVNQDRITPHAEAFQAVVWHLMVSHPKLKATETKWESLNTKAADPYLVQIDA